MKFQLFIGGVMLLAMGACKTPYKATDQPRSAMDSTTSTVDSTSSTMNNTASPVDTTTTMNNVATSDTTARTGMDSAKVDSGRVIDSASQQLPDSSKMLSKPDSTQVQPGVDSAMNNAATDSSNAQTTTDAVPAKDSSSANTAAPAAVESVFTKQYAGATNIVWSAYDSLAATPIDLRLTGWKKMDAEDHMVKFDYKDENYYAWYDNSGKWVGSAYTMKDLTKLPPAVNTAVNNAIKSRYKEYNVSQVNREMQTGKKPVYEVELKKDDSKVRMLVTTEGKISQIFKYSADKSK